MIDTRYQIETPEGIDLQADLAGPSPRALAFLVDFAIRIAVYIAASIVLGLAGWAYGFFLVLVFLLEWFYPVVFEVMLKGQTPGKQIMGLVVVNDDLTPVTWQASIIRNLLRTADILPMGYLFGLSSMLISQRFQRLGDLAAGTLVVHKIPAPKPAELPSCPPVAPAQAMELDEQTAVVIFTERHGQLTDSRKQELANILFPLHGLENEQAVNHLHGLGRWLLGDKP